MPGVCLGSQAGPVGGAGGGVEPVSGVLGCRGRQGGREVMRRASLLARGSRGPAGVSPAS